jgi:hypothetical protein
MVVIFDQVASVVVSQPADYGARAMDHLAPEIMISSLADAAESGFTAGQS